LKLQWSNSAEQDLDQIYAFIAIDSPRSAAGVGNRILQAAEALRSFPRKGRPGRLDGTRELVVSQTSYLIIYEAYDGHISILRIVHGAQLWPPADVADP
jgi:toxin ParE1/3/4